MAAPKAPKPEGSYKTSTDVIYGVDFRPDLTVAMNSVNRGGRYMQNITTDQIVDTIEETFQAAQTTPSHPTRPDLTATEVYPIVPGLDFLCNFYALVKFREAPEAVIDLDDDVSPAEKTLLIANSIASCSTSDKIQNALDCSLLVPNVDFINVDLESFLEEPDEKREYTLAAHFDFIENELAQKDNLFLAIDKDLRVATFNKIGTVYNARLRSKQEEPEIYHLNPTHIDPESLAFLEKLRADYEDPPLPTEDVDQ